MANKPIRVRFAPSPTGELHVGGARTALYNYLFARGQGGKFIIRIEDTDRERLVEGSLDRLLEGLRWLGLTWDEGPDIGGPHGPYIQSERLKRYAEVATELVKKGAAYYCFCTAQRLEILREVQHAEHKPTRYDRECIKLSPTAVEQRLSAQEPHTIRLKVPEGTTIFTDVIRGQVSVANTEIDDQVLMKSDGFPTYHLANVADDHDMAISHVIRGEEWLPSTPKHVLLYQALNWEPPAWAHLPNVLNEKRAKLSKRKDGAAVWVNTYRELGYLPQALMNFLSLLGWHPADDRELFTLEDLTPAFSLDRVQKSGAIFSLEKLNWFNAEYIKKLNVDELDKLLQPAYSALATNYGRAVTGTSQLTAVLQTRISTLASIETQAAWFFKADVTAPAALLVPKNGTKERTQAALSEAQVILSKIGDWTPEEVQRSLEVLIRPGTFTRQEVLWPVRTALTGEQQSPDVFGVAWALGREECMKRLQGAQTSLSA